jgi:hypothetical protein
LSISASGGTTVDDHDPQVTSRVRWSATVAGEAADGSIDDRRAMP